jgi:hypothetical protein
MSLQDMEVVAKKRFTSWRTDFIAGGVGGRGDLRANREALIESSCGRGVMVDGSARLILGRAVGGRAMAFPDSFSANRWKEPGDSGRGSRCCAGSSGYQDLVTLLQAVRGLSKRWRVGVSEPHWWQNTIAKAPRARRESYAGRLEETFRLRCCDLFVTCWTIQYNLPLAQTRSEPVRLRG